jgi:lysophospholipase L1-like esterase|tara:strand:- start:882 stop:2117 length:1236 start_codon:yes stop_codon:yes gene_type:complete
MQMINLTKGAIILSILLFISGLTISSVFDVDFVEKYIDDDGRIGEHVKIRISIFQNQMLYLSLFFGLIGILMLIFSKDLIRILNKKKALLINIIFLSVLLIGFLIVGEVILRVFFSQQIYSEYGSGPGGLKFINNVEYNSLGFRDIEHNTEKDDDISRILIIGDSFTFGYSIDDLKNVYPRILQKKLDDNYGKNKFEVITLAQGGYSTIDAVKAIKNVGINLSPDLIILGYYANDAEGPDSRVGFEKMFFHHYLIPYEAGSWLYTHSFFYYFLESRTKNLIRGYGLEKKSSKDYIAHLYSDSNPFFREHQGYLADFIDSGKRKGIPVVIMNIPVITDFNQYPFYFVNDYVENITISNGALYLDILPYLSEYGSNEVIASFMDSHINELGNNIIADALFDFLNENQLIGDTK